MKHRKGKREIKRRIAAVFICLCLVVNLISLPALAAGKIAKSGGALKNGASGLCEHHTKHTEWCGYSDGETDSPCIHVHDQGCWEKETQCVHTHTADCFSDEVSESDEGEDEATIKDGEKKSEPVLCNHKCSEESGCITDKLNCPHEKGNHDEKCGYKEKGNTILSPCNFVCPICKEQAPDLEEGEWEHTIRGSLIPGVSAESLDELLDAPRFSARRAVGSRIDVSTDINHYINVYINGKIFKNGDTINALVGDSFSYQFFWAPGKTFGPGDFFDIELFKVPGLNFQPRLSSSLVIDNIKVGEWIITYDKVTGVMNYHVEFNRYIQFFAYDTIIASLQGNATFQGVQSGTPIQVGNVGGTLNVEPRPTKPIDPYPSGGIGWKPQTPPVLNDNRYPFGKGVKWTSNKDPNAIPQIDWRAPFLTMLQERQSEFLTNPDKALSDVQGNCLIEDKLDPNQRFYYPGDDGNRFGGNAPFYLELPVAVPGTGVFLNGGHGNGGYDGAGEIYPYVTGHSFHQIDGSKVTTAGDMTALRRQVESTPMSWTVYMDPRDGREVLYINLGILGAKRGENTKGINWGMSRGSTLWPNQGIQNLINNCDNKIEALENGADSPISLLDSRRDALVNLLNRAVNFSANSGSKEQAQKDMDQWRNAYFAWRATPGIDPLSQLTDPDGKLIPMPELPSQLLQDLADPNGKGGKVKETAEYKNFIASYNNLYADQGTYLNNRTSYRDGWENVKKAYQDALKFYENGQVFGFVAKVRTRVSNTSMKNYSNNISVSIGDRQWTAFDETNVSFANSITGNYALGTAVFQKADALYDTGKDEEDIKKVQGDKAGLTGAKFKVYCEDPSNGFVENDDHLAYFLEKDASMNGDTYMYTHTGGLPSGAVLGEVTDLEVGADGRINLGNLAITHKHYLVETEAPGGHYLDKTPIEVEIQKDSVIYRMVPNVSRAVKLSKVDSHSKQPVKGAQFALYKIEGITQTPLSFSEKEINGHKTYWPNAAGTAVLQTDEEGNLCVHGLEAGEYLLEETQPAPGYKDPLNTVQRNFTLENELPTNKTGYDDAWHYLLTDKNPLTNDPKTTSMTFTKRTNNGVLEGAGYALFRFKGSEAKWKEDPDNVDMWEPVNLTKSDGDYFHTDNAITTGKVPMGNGGADLQVNLAESAADGTITIKDIPVGHYSISEIKAPGPYIRDYSNYYFHVNGDTIGKDIQLYRTANTTTQTVQNNDLYNYTEMSKLALIKYDAGETQPTLTGGTEIQNSPMGNNVWHYQDTIGTTGGKPLSGAVYKLFQRDFNDGKINPHPNELTTTAIQRQWDRVHDHCLAVGTTDANGVLKLDNMVDSAGDKVDQGLHMGNYYMIEVKAPEGYRLTQEPVWFTIDFSAFPTTGTPGLIRMASNAMLDYGIKLIKKDAENDAALSGAEFTLTREGENVPITFSYNASTGRYFHDVNGNATLTTLFDGGFTVTGLTPGKFILTETKAPNGYKKAEPQKITIEKFTSSTTEDVVLQNVEIKDERLKGKVQLYKTDWETLQPLPGAKFQLYRVNVIELPDTHPDYDPDQGLTYTEEIPIGSPIVTDENGTLSIDNLDWTEGYDFYYLQETEAPSGYVNNISRLQFTINATSFYEDGNPIPVIFRARNAKGIAGKVTVCKVDHDDPDKKLEDAHFFLTREVDPDVWIAYGKGIYITDADGKFTIPLPPGNYALMEMKAPNGYLGELGEYHYFTIDDKGNNTEPKPIELEITNIPGSAGVYLKKMVEFTDIPIPGVEFQFFQGNFFFNDMLYFKKEKDGLYRCVGKDPADGAVTNVATDNKGELRLIFGHEYLVDTSDPTDALKKGIFYQEVSAPSGVKVDNALKMIKSFDEVNKPGCLQEGFWSDNDVFNALNDDPAKLAIVLNKEGENGKPLAGARFKLYFKFNDQELQLFEEVTGADGSIIFQNQNAPGSLHVGGTYYIQETKAPPGYVLNDTVYEVTLGANVFDQDFNFQPVYVNNGEAINNQRIKGTVELIKVDENKNPLAGAQFELLRQSENGAWNTYGDPLYTTGDDGKITLTLPFGNYRWIERKAPFGYLLDVTEQDFTIVTDGQHVTVGPLENKVDPTPRGDVTVVKTEQGNPNIGLGGAKFQLYFRRDDGSYALYDNTVYASDAEGKFTVTALPVGSYGFREIEAPENYQLSDRLWMFSISKKGEAVTLSVTNIKKTGGGGVGETPGSGPDSKPNFVPEPKPDTDPKPNPDPNPDLNPNPDLGSDINPGFTEIDKSDNSNFSSKANGFAGINPYTGDINSILFWLILTGIGATGLVLMFRSFHKWQDKSSSNEEGKED